MRMRYICIRFMPIIWCINIGTISSSPNLWCDYVFLIKLKKVTGCQGAFSQAHRYQNLGTEKACPLLHNDYWPWIVDKVVPTEIYTAHNLKKNRDFLLGFPWEHPSFKMGLVFPSGTNCPVASSARAQDISICAYFCNLDPNLVPRGRDPFLGTRLPRSQKWRSLVDTSYMISIVK